MANSQSRQHETHDISEMSSKSQNHGSDNNASESAAPVDQNAANYQGTAPAATPEGAPPTAQDNAQSTVR